jgi:hypothetical protein
MDIEIEDLEKKLAKLQTCKARHDEGIAHWGNMVSINAIIVFLICRKPIKCK